MSNYGSETLLLRPRAPVDKSTIESRLASRPGAFRDPHDAETWILPSLPSQAADLLAWRTAHPREFTSDARVTLDMQGIQVAPGNTGISEARARSFITWLLAHTPCELIVHGNDIGLVTSPGDIYDSADWDNPEDDPTESPPWSGRLLTVYRLPSGGGSETLAIHDSRLMSYQQLTETGGGEKTFRRLSPRLCEHIFDLVDGLPFGDEPGVGADGVHDYIDPIFIRLETAEEYLHDTKIDAQDAKEPYRTFLALVDGWIAAFRQNRDAVPDSMKMARLGSDSDA